jgi:uncharacterized protein YutE (UPF0331/DUF86 family)
MSATKSASDKLNQLKKDCDQLNTYGQISLDEFLANPNIQDETCYLLLTVFQDVQDIGNELLDDLDLARSGSASDVLTLLGEEEILSDVCVSQLKALQGLCTSLGQRRGEIDPQWIYQALQVNLAGLEQFADQVRTFLDK